MQIYLLGLAHEIYFIILREEVLFGKNRPREEVLLWWFWWFWARFSGELGGFCGIAEHFSNKCRNSPKELNK